MIKRKKRGARMKKGGTFSLVCYIIYTLIGVAALIYNRLGIENAEGWDSIGYALLFAVAIVFAGASAVGLVLKLLHMGTGFGLFGFLCILVDIAFVLFFAGASIEDIGGLDISALAITIPIILISIGSLISNIRSLKN